MTIAVAVPQQNPEKAPPAAVPGVTRPTEPAHVVKNDAEAIAIATRLAERFAAGASARDRNRERPLAELDAFSQSGLWSINVPKAFGGPELSYVTLAKVIEIISAADPSLGQIPQNRLGVVAAIRIVSDPVQQKLLFDEALRGTRFGNAFWTARRPGRAEFRELSHRSVAHRRSAALRCSRDRRQGGGPGAAIGNPCSTPCANKGEGSGWHWSRLNNEGPCAIFVLIGMPGGSASRRKSRQY